MPHCFLLNHHKYAERKWILHIVQVQILVGYNSIQTLRINIHKTEIRYKYAACDTTNLMFVQAVWDHSRVWCPQVVGIWTTFQIWIMKWEKGFAVLFYCWSKKTHCCMPQQKLVRLLQWLNKVGLFFDSSINVKCFRTYFKLGFQYPCTK